MAGFMNNNTVVPTRYNGMRLTQALLGQPIPMLFGTRRLSGKLFWYGDFTSSIATNGGKKGGGSGGGAGGKKGGQQYVYSASVIAGLCMGNCQGLLSVWDSTGKYVVQSISETFVIPPGGGSYQVTENSVFNTDQGPALQAAYSAAVNDFGSPGPSTLSGIQGVPMSLVVGSPSTGQYLLNEANGTYTFSAADAGKEVIVNYTAWRWLDEESIVTVVPNGGGTITIENQPYFSGDGGVLYYPSGVALTAVGGNPTIAGTYNPNNGNYKFAAADSLKGITISWQYAVPLASQDLNAPNTLNLTFISGAKSQLPWSYLTTKHPSQALGYTEVAYIASSGLYLGFVPELPNYNYEIAGPLIFGGGIPDANPSDCIDAVLTDLSMGIGFPSQSIDSSLLGLTRAFWTANNFFISPLIESYVTAASCIGDWCEAGQVGNFWSEGLFKFVPYGTASAIGNGAAYTPPTQPLETFTDQDYLPANNGGKPVKISRKPWQDAYNRVGIQWSVRANDYNSDVTPEQDDAAISRYGLRPERAKGFDFICTLNAATFAANMRLQRYVNIRNTYTFCVQSSFSWLEPMDIVELNDSYLGLNNTAVRILRILDDPKKGLTITAEDFPWASGNPSLYTKQAVQPSTVSLPGQALPGDTSLIMIETPNPNSLVQGSVLSVFATGLSSSWGGCILQKAVGTHSCSITKVQIVSDVLTITGPNTLISGDIATFYDLGAASFMNGQTVTVLTASPAGFTAPFTNADYNKFGTISDSGDAWATTAYQPFAVVYKPARVGELALNDFPSPLTSPLINMALPAYSGANPEYELTSPLTSPLVPEHVYVDMVFPGATLESISAASASGPYPVTLAAIITNGVAEMISYQNATLVPGSQQAGSRYELDTLYRGLLGTSGVEHFVGDIFIRMDDASATYDYDPSLYGETIFLLATSFNTMGGAQQSQADGVTYKLKLKGTEYVGGSTAHLSYRPIGLTMTGHDTGTVPEIIISAFSLRVPGLPDVAVNGGSVFMLNTQYSTLAYVYYDDPALQGGTVAYNTTTTKEVALQGLGRVFIGSIVTPAAGAPDTTSNNDGGVGAQSGTTAVFLFGTTAVTSGGSTPGIVTNPNFAIDGNMTTFADVLMSGTETGSVTLTLSTASPTSASWTSLTLNVLSSVIYTIGPNATGVLKYSLDGGTSFTTIYSKTNANRAQQIDSVAIPTDQNLALVRVVATLSTTWISGTLNTIEQTVYQAWVVGRS